MERENHAVVGDFHLCGAANEVAIDATVEGFKEFSPDLIVPGHCTGWRAVHALVTQFEVNVVPMDVGMGLGM